GRRTDREGPPPSRPPRTAVAGGRHRRPGGETDDGTGGGIRCRLRRPGGLHGVGIGGVDTPQGVAPRPDEPHRQGARTKGRPTTRSSGTSVGVVASGLGRAHRGRQTSPAPTGSDDTGRGSGLDLSPRRRRRPGRRHPGIRTLPSVRHGPGASHALPTGDGSGPPERHNDQERNRAMPVTLTDHAVRHTSTVPASAGWEIDLFLHEYDGHTGPPGGRRAVLMLHGRSVPVLAGFDLRHKSYSWADALAKAGYDVFLMDLQGSGRSPRPKMDDPCNVNPAVHESLLTPNPLSGRREPGYPYQLNNSHSDRDELHTVVEYIRRLRGVAKVSFVGWSAASFVMG